MIKCELINNCGIIKLNRPEKRNSLHPSLLEQFINQIYLFEKDKKVNSIIITGEGSSFCSGADLSYLNLLRSNSILSNEKDSKLISEFFLSVYKCCKLTIAAVNGPAIAGGSGLVSVCDFVIADIDKAKFGFTEVKIGFLPAIVSLFLIKRIGEAKARQLLISGKIINSKDALIIGLVDEVSNDVLKSSFDLAAKINENSIYSIVQTKKMIRDISNLNFETAINYLYELNVISRTSKDFKEGLNNFLKNK